VGILGIALRAGAGGPTRWLAVVLRSALPALFMLGALLLARVTALNGIASPPARLIAAVLLGIAACALAARVFVPHRLGETARLLLRRG
jgi:hypothetical protein